MHPTILVTYNRPDHLSRVLEALENLRIEPLYIFSDGSKDEEDAEKVAKVRMLLENRIDWTDPVMWYREENVGLGKSILFAVNTVLEQYDTMILLEDDCIPYPGFFGFMYDCLDKYASQDSVMSIGGYTMTMPEEVLKKYRYDVYFVTRIESWGWGTWKRAWQYYESAYAAAYTYLQGQGIDYARDGHSTVRNTEKAIAGRKDGVFPWTPGWMMALFLRDGYCVYPTRPLIENIGLDGSGASCVPTSYYDVRSSGEWHPTRFPRRPFVDPKIHSVVKEFYR